MTVTLTIGIREKVEGAGGRRGRGGEGKGIRRIRGCSRL